MDDQETEKRTRIFKTDPDRGFVFTAWKIGSRDSAHVRIERDGEIVREFPFPLYKIWNIAAHTADIIDNELNKENDRYMLSCSDGLGGEEVGQ